MPTGDGLLVRVHVPNARLSLAQARGLARLSERFGNGRIDVTSRGNLQIRGVAPTGQGPLSREIEQLGLLEPDVPGPPRLTIVGPLAGHDETAQFDAAAIASAIEAACRRRAGLSDKFAIALDDGGRFALDGLPCDLRFSASGEGRAAVALASATGPKWIGTLAVSDIPAAAHQLVELVRSDPSSGGGRMRDLSKEVQGRMEAALTPILGPVRQPPPRSLPPMAGLLRSNGDAMALVAGLPFGHCEAAQLAALSEHAAQAEAGEIRLSYTRAFVVPGLADRAGARIADAAGELGFIVDARDPRLGIKACVGRPHCASGYTRAPSDADGLAASAAEWLDAGGSLHVSGCAKGCAQAGPAALTLVGGPDGRYGIVLDGTAGAQPSLRLARDEIADRLARVGGRRDIRSVFRDGQ